MKPILFSTKMVQAILDDRKTQTRRIMRGQPQLSVDFTDTTEEFQRAHNRPRYAVGDILYVRETWNEGKDGYVYRATPPKFSRMPEKWVPSVHMPKKAARIFLRVTKIRAERLQNIMLRDVTAEGIYPSEQDWQNHAEASTPKPPAPFCFFAKNWDDIYGKGAWDENPWVWVYEFERVDEETIK